MVDSSYSLDGQLLTSIIDFYASDVAIALRADADSGYIF